MADLDLDVALDAVRDFLGVSFPDVNVAVAEDVDGTDVAVPALLVQFSEIEPDPDGEPLTGQFPCMVRVQARVIVGHRTPSVRMATLKLAGAVAAIVHTERFGVHWGGAKVIAVEPDEFSPSADRFDVWMVEWIHHARLGSAFEFGDDFQPTELLVSFSPRVGPAHVAAYDEAGS